MTYPHPQFHRANIHSRLACQHPLGGLHSGHFEREDQAPIASGGDVFDNVASDGRFPALGFGCYHDQVTSHERPSHRIKAEAELDHVGTGRMSLQLQHGLLQEMREAGFLAIRLHEYSVEVSASLGEFGFDVGGQVEGVACKPLPKRIKPPRSLATQQSTDDSGKCVHRRGFGKDRLQRGFLDGAAHLAESDCERAKVERHCLLPHLHQRGKNFPVMIVEMAFGDSRG